MKYINHIHRGIVIFSETQSHKEMAEMIGSPANWKDEIISAGFVHQMDWCNDGKAVVSGESTSLGKSCNNRDGILIQAQLSRG